MATKKTVKKEKAEKAEQPQEAAPQTEEKPQIQLKSGYVVGLTTEGRFHFEVVGDDVNIPELSGLHHFASTKIEDAMDRASGVNSAVTRELSLKVDELGLLLNKLVESLSRGGAKL